MYTCIAFDVDGTLIDTERAVLTTLRAVLKEETGADHAEEALYEAIGVPGEVTMERFGVADPEGGFMKWTRYLAEARHMNRLYPGTEKTLEAVRKAGYTMAIVTNRRRFEVFEDPLYHTIAPYFDAVVCGDDVKSPKPAPDPLLELGRRVGCKPSEILFLGDTEIDFGCARSAGAGFALAGWGALNPEALGAETVLSQPWDLMRHLLVNCGEEPTHEVG